MTSLFDDLKEGLQEAIAFAKGEGPARVTRFEIEPVITYTNVEIREIRTNAKMTQAVFALYMGVSIKTVEAWESGRTHPTGPLKPAPLSVEITYRETPAGDEPCGIFFAGLSGYATNHHFQNAALCGTLIVARNMAVRGLAEAIYLLIFRSKGGAACQSRMSMTTKIFLKTFRAAGAMT